MRTVSHKDGFRQRTDKSIDRASPDDCLRAAEHSYKSEGKPDNIWSKSDLTVDSCHIQIQVDGDGKDRTLSVLDDGTGISTQAVEKRLHILQRGENRGCGPLNRA